MKKLLFILLAFTLSIGVQAKNLEILSGEMALNHTLAADVPDHEIQTYIGEKGLADFYRRYETHFGEFVRAEDPREVDFDFVIGLSKFKETV
ncbi:MAG: hypothetical protein MJK04_23925, partial [Psychrosphaera sp.]|nr:hypothetical protein [Psychrosphaera sp.]